MKTKKLREVLPVCELELMSVDRAAKILRVNKREIMNWTDKFRQSGGHDGLPYIAKGSRKLIRAGALKAYLIAQERKEAAA